MISLLNTFLWITIVVTVVLGFLICFYMPYKAIQKIRAQRAEAKAAKEDK